MAMLKWFAAHRYNYIDLLNCGLGAAVWFTTEWYWGLLAVVIGAFVSVAAERVVGVR